MLRATRPSFARRLTFTVYHGPALAAPGRHEDYAMKCTLTLSRWHHVAERINTALKEREAGVKTAFTATAVSPWNKEDIEAKAERLAQRAAEDLLLFEIGVQAVATIRAVLARRNAELGVSAKLSEVESENRRAALYKAVLDGQTVDMVRPENVRTLPAEAVSKGDLWGFGRRRSEGAVTLELANADLLDSLRARLAQAQGHAVRLLDEVADLNREKAEIDVPEAIAAIAGLAG